MKRAALFFDIDGTLTDNETGLVVPSAIEAIAKAREKGHLAFVNTGRTISCIQPHILQLGFDGFLCGCGTYATYLGEEIYRHELDRKIGLEIINKARELKVPVFYEGNEDAWYAEETYGMPEFQTFHDYYDPLGVGLNSIEPGEELPYEKLYVITDEKHRENTRIFLEYVSQYLDIIDRGHEQYEVVQKECTKGKIIHFIQERFGIAEEDVYAFGDSSNDLKMFEHAKHTIAMKDHSPLLDPHTEFVTKSPKERGIEYALKHYELI